MLYHPPISPQFTYHCEGAMMRNPQQSERNILTRRRDSRPTIGLFFEGVEEYYTLIWSGAVEVAQAQDANLIAFVGQAPGKPTGFLSQETIIYNLANDENIDGLIMVTGNLNKYIPPEEFAAFCQRYAALPMVSLVDKLPGIPSAMVDNQTGLRDLLTHLVVDHCYRRIA